MAEKTAACDGKNMAGLLILGKKCFPLEFENVWKVTFGEAGELN